MCVYNSGSGMHVRLEQRYCNTCVFSTGNGLHVCLELIVGCMSSVYVVRQVDHVTL